LIASGRGATGSRSNCSAPRKNHDITVEGSNSVRRDGVDNVDVEAIASSGAAGVGSVAEGSIHPGSVMPAGC
jgi:hypothetical protein